MPKSLKDILAGVKSSKVVPGSTGSDPGVDYAPKAPNEQEFVKKHKVEKHADRVGNGDDVYQATNVKHSQIKDTKHGYKKPQDQKVNEEEELAEARPGSYDDYPDSWHHDAYWQRGRGSVHTYGNHNNQHGHIVAKVDPKTKSRVWHAHAYGDFDRRVNDYAQHKTIDAAKKWVQKRSVELVKQHHQSKKKKINEAASCNMTAEGTHCPVHEMSACSGYDKKKTLREISKKSVKEDLAVPLLGGDDESAEMAKTQLRALASKAMQLVAQLNDDQVVEPWVQAKIAVAKDNVSAVHDYMVYGNHDKPEDEQTAPYDGSVDMTGAPRQTWPSFSADVNTGRNV